VTPEVRTRLADEDRWYNLYAFDLASRIVDAAAQSEQVANGLTLPVRFGDTAELLGYHLAHASESARDLTLITYWRAGAHIVTPLQLFVHAIGPDGRILAQEDRLDASPFGWRSGDVIAQLNRLSLPAGAGRVTIEIGLYSLDTGERLPVVVDGREVDRQLQLEQIEIE
jgi:hypothetical protein